MDGSFIKKGRGELTVKEGIHPNYAETTITCACGNVIKAGSTKKSKYFLKIIRKTQASPVPVFFRNPLDYIPTFKGCVL